MPNTVVVDTKSAWASKINWTQAVTLASVLLAFFGFPIPDDVKAELIAAITAVSAVVTWVLRTFFSSTVLHASAPKL